MDGKLVDGGSVRGALGEGPTLESTRTRVQDIIGIGTGQGGGEWNIEGEVDGRVNAGGRSHRRCAVRSTKRVGAHIGVRSRHAESGCHSLPAMTGLTRKVGDLVHDKGKSSLWPLERVEGRGGGGSSSGEKEWRMNRRRRGKKEKTRRMQQ